MMSSLTRIPRNAFKEVLYRLKGRQKKFEAIYRNNWFGGNESVSGPGSSLEQTHVIREQLPKLIKDLGVKTFMDAPCGDFHWMSKVALNIDKYIGIDIVPDLIRANQQKYSSEDRKFLALDIVNDELPTADFIMCRDCFIHLSNKDIKAALKNIHRAHIVYLLTTTFTDLTVNTDIVTGHIRPINLQAPPFNFPEPLIVINENCTEGDGAFFDKSLALWRVADITYLK